MTNALKLTALGLSVMFMAGCAANGGEMDAHHDVEARATAQDAMTAAEQAQMTADQALQMAQENRQAMDRMFQSSMQK